MKKFLHIGAWSYLAALFILTAVLYTAGMNLRYEGLLALLIPFFAMRSSYHYLASKGIKRNLDTEHSYSSHTEGLFINALAAALMISIIGLSLSKGVSAVAEEFCAYALMSFTVSLILMFTIRFIRVSFRPAA